MQVLCCADTHGFPPRASAASALCWLHAGDALDYCNPQSTMTDWAKSQATPVYAVRGNHDCKDPYGFFGAVREVSGNVVRIAEKLVLVGVGWHGESYIDIPKDSDLQPVCNRILNKITAEVQSGDRFVVLSHYPPKTTYFHPPYHEGYNCITELIELIMPVLVVFGHIHEWGGQSVLHPFYKSTLVNPGRTGQVVEF